MRQSRSTSRRRIAGRVGWGGGPGSCPGPLFSPRPEPPVLDREDEVDDDSEYSDPPPSPEPVAPKVDRATVVRELAGLFSDEGKPKPRAVPSRSGDRKAPPDPAQKRRIEDDEDVDRGLITRMIDGVKEL